MLIGAMYGPGPMEVYALIVMKYCTYSCSPVRRVVRLLAMTITFCTVCSNVDCLYSTSYAVMIPLR